MVESTFPSSLRVPGLLRGPLTEGGRWQRGVEVAVSLLGGCDHASVTVLTPHYVETVAVSDQVARRGDGWQHELSEGPGLDSLRRRVPVVSQDLRSDPRWRAWGPRAVEQLGVRSVVSVPLESDGGDIGALNLYADRLRVWDDEQQELAWAFAAQVAAAASDARLLERRTAAILMRSGTGQAQGMVMERFQMTAEQAFDYLQRLSEDGGIGLQQVAEHITGTRDFPRLRGEHPGRGRRRHP